MLQRLVRLFAYGGTTLILALYLSALGNSDEKIGLFMTLTLLGDVVISLVLTATADGIGRRRMLGLGSILMTVSGVVFATCSNYWILVVASVLGVISPSGNEIGPFKAIEESTISHLVPATERSSVLAWYILVGPCGTAMSTILTGFVVQRLQEIQSWTVIESYGTVFWAYAVMGLVQLLLTLMLSSKCEIQKKSSTEQPPDIDETRPLLTDGTAETNGKPPCDDAKPVSFLKTLLPSLSKESSGIVFKLCFLFAIDSIASGLTPASWVTYFFNRKFGLSEGHLGSLFFITNILSSASNLVASSIVRRIGLIKTMVFTHVPASITLALIPLPSNVVFAMTLLIFRACTNSMDQAPRQAFLAAAVLPNERTAVMGLVNVVKTLSQSLGPVVTGALAGKGKFWVAFVVAGSLKLGYDVLMLGMFLGYKTQEERAEARVQQTEEEEQAEDTVGTRDNAR